MQDEFNQEQARKTAILLGIPADFVKKDFFVTKAIHALTHVDNDYFSLVFQGGTSLSKGYQVIQRLSEDIDFRVSKKELARNIGKSKLRIALRDYRYALIDTLRQLNFIIDEKEIKVFYEGRYSSFKASFNQSDEIPYLRPHIAIECFLGEVVLPPNNKPTSTLTKVILGEECQHRSIPVSCIAMDETAAEKWVALT